MAGEISRQEYAARYGPTAGDRIRLGDSNLVALIERRPSWPAGRKRRAGVFEIHDGLRRLHVRA